ncbi:peptidyl-prolyl cis-trans isomerase C [Pseudonocardia ammonioxydans]|uniref:peptidylprolyl isomerase n=1 Tax=Pseudonocardia ammonioxydans TaxID=260086 RepID=A0A1I5I2G4_PSUAM|nr:peptidyl-prolyl cis-trans isomerase [Pseudonocardia ammonioxydans]SFO54306.1 peptidyl-prolyl cis-trans isomerase C [Pseudonocardia ammonioxydans]
MPQQRVSRPRANEDPAANAPVNGTERLGEHQDCSSAQGDAAGSTEPDPQPVSSDQISDHEDTVGDDRTDAAAPPDPAAPDTETAEADCDEDAATSDGSGDARLPLHRRLLGPAMPKGRTLAAALVVVLLVGVGGIAWWRLTALPAEAAFRYDGDVVTIEQLDQRIDALRALYGVEAPEDPAQADGFRRDVAKSVAVSEILDDAAEERQIVVADKQVQDTLDRYIEQQFGPGNRDAFVQALGNVGTSEPAVRDEIRRQLTVGELMQQVVGTITISDEDLRTAYDQRKDTLGTPERRSISNIVVASQQDAQAALDQLNAGAPVAEVAATWSLDASTKDKGGAIGEVARADLEQPVADAAFSVGSGQFFGPVQGRHGWNVGRVDSVSPFVPATFEQVADGLRSALQTERSLTVWRDWLGQQISDADVDYADAYRPADPDAAPTMDPAGPPAETEPPR